ncbi:MAG: sulfotransferase [Rhizobiaceae bacterium]|nr:sulfotransferase [Rhizobiaceae bacterium]
MRNPFRTEKLGSYTPFCWYGSRWRTWHRILRSGGYDVTLNRLPNIIGVTAMTPAAFVVDHVTEAVYGRRANRTDVLPPIFVLGHWRSGTTFLHNLIGCDPEFAYPNVFQCTFAGGFPLLERWTGWLMTPFLPATRPMDDVPIGRAVPFEDEFALMKRDAGSPYLDLAFPRHAPSHTRFLDFQGATDAERAKWEDSMMWLMRRFQLVNPGKRLVLKSPQHTARVATLLKLFPEARFVHVSRDPFEIYQSTLKLWRVLNSRFGLHNPANDADWLPDYVLSTLPRMYAAYERDRALIPEGRLAEIAYEDLAADPVGTLRTAYDTAGLGDFERARPEVERYLAGLAPHTARPVRLSEAERASVAERWASYARRFGYSPGGGRDGRQATATAAAE